MKGRKIIFASPHSVLDRTSGAAISMRTILERLAQRGAGVASLTATIFDSPRGAAGIPPPPAEAAERRFRPYPVMRNGVRHLIMRTAQQRRWQMTAMEQEAFERSFRDILRRASPDVMFLFGGMLLERHMLAEARQRGVVTVFYLVNPSYTDALSFRDADLVVTDSAATAALYKERMGLDVKVIGTFIDPEGFRAATREPQFVTFVNPSPEKGVALVARLAMMCRETLPDVRFLVVESRGRWLPALERLGLAADEFPNVRVLPLQRDMRPVYARTRLLIVPSFWHDSGPRVAAEALFNGIPVLASDHGGIGDVLAGGGVLLPIPEAVRTKPNALPGADAAAPWFEEIRRLTTDEEAYRAQSAKALAAAASVDIEASTDRLTALLEPLLAARAAAQPVPA
jgi:glycosyltransferase involved in cell wall biosynthesis